jgi:DNA-binding winged helix-turn-helix (wHTH) protein/Tol biopolymer transport system component
VFYPPAIIVLNQPQSPTRLVFGPFEVNAPAGELRKKGIRIPLSNQPLQILLVLLAHPGDVVSREALRKQIWGQGTFVDFEHSLNATINKVRQALGDSAENPHYIETVPGRGYRFIGSVQQKRSGDIVAPVLCQMPVEFTEQIAKRGSKKTWMAAGALTGAVFVACILIAMALQRPAARSEARVQQLTTNSAENPVWNAVISPDGKYVAYGDMAGIQVRLIKTGESHLLPKPRSLKVGDMWFPAAWLPDGARILATSITSTAVTAWTVPVIGGTASVLRENALVQSASPDGSSVAFITSRHMRVGENEINRRLMWDSEIWIVEADGENARRVVPGDKLTYFGSVEWSPDGKRIAYQRFRTPRGGLLVDYTIESCDLNGRMTSVIVTLHHYRSPSTDHNFPEDFCWLGDGRIVYAVREPPPNIRDSNLWQVTLDPNSGKPQTPPRRLTSLAGFHMQGLSVSADGRRLIFESSSDQSHVYVAQVQTNGKLANVRLLTPDERYNTPFDWTSDSKAVLFRSDRTGAFALYKQALDEDVAERIPTGSGNPDDPRVTPDGLWIIYPNLVETSSGRQYRLMRLRLVGGAPEVIFDRVEILDYDCARRPGAQCVMSEASSDGTQQVVSSFDPVSAERRELFRADRNVNWILSPDGSRFATDRVNPPGGIDTRSLTGQIEIRSLTGNIERTIQLKGWPHPYTLDFAADGKSLFVSHTGLIDSPSGPIGTTLLHVDFQGNAQPIWETRGARYTFGIPSRDGRYLAIRGATTSCNAWMIENF